MRSMARCVFPVLVGPSTAVTPAPRGEDARLDAEENEIGIGWLRFIGQSYQDKDARGQSGGCQSSACMHPKSVPQCNGKSAYGSLCLICGTSLERIEAESLTRSLSEFVHG